MIIPGFKGGRSSSLYDPIEKQTYQSAVDLDVFSQSNILTPLVGLFADAGTLTGTGNILGKSMKLSDGKIYVIGETTITAAKNIIIYQLTTSDFDFSSTFTNFYSSSSSSVVPEFDELNGFIIVSVGTDLKKIALATGAVTSIGTLTTAGGSIKTNTGMKKTAIVHNSGKSIATWDGTTFVTTALALGAGETCFSIDEYGAFFLVGVTRPNGSAIYVWNGSANTIEDKIDCSGNLVFFRNVNGTIVGIGLSLDSMSIYSGTPGSTLNLVLEKKYGTKYGFSTNAKPYTVVGDAIDDILVFGINWSGTTITSGFESGIYAFGRKFLTDNKIFTLARLPSGGTPTVSFHGISNVSGELIVNYTATPGNATILCHTNAGVTGGSAVMGKLTANGVYETNAIPLKGGLDGIVESIIINHNPMPVSCGFTVQIRHYGNYPWDGTVPSQESYQDLIIPSGSGSSTGKTQSTTNSTYTIIKGHPAFKTARYVQLKILFDEVSGITSPEIIFPIILEVK